MYIKLSKYTEKTPIRHEIEDDSFHMWIGSAYISIDPDDVFNNMDTFEALRFWLECKRVEVEREAK